MRTLPETVQAITPVMIACIDSSTGLINYHNPRFLKRTGYTSDQVLNRSIFQFIHECTFIQLAKALKDIKYNSSLTLRVGLKDINNQRIDCQLQISRRSEDDFLIYLFFIDNQKQRQKDNELGVYQRIIYSSQEMMSLVDTQYRYVIVNNAYLKHFQLKEQEIIGKTVWEIQGDKAPRIIQKLDEAFNSGQTTRFQTKIYSPATQSTMHMDCLYVPYYNQSDEIIGIIVSAHDISDAKRTEDAISSSNSYYKALFQYSPDLLASISLETGRILEANQTLESALDYDEGELTGQHLFKFHGKAHKKVLAEAIVELSNNHPIHSLAVSLIAKDGSTISADLKTTPVIDDHKRIAIFVWRDTRYQEKLAYKAAHDPLTHLLNRSGFMPLLEKPFGVSEKRVLCFLDIDNFKKLNDTCGHLCGDQFLIDIADLLRHNINDNDELCRLGGDEFLLLIRNQTLEQANKLMRVILLKINGLIKSSRKYLKAELGVSIGVTTFNANESSRTVLTRADKACYESKRNGKNQVSMLKEPVTS